jgi:hypothetical protein
VVQELDDRHPFRPVLTADADVVDHHAVGVEPVTAQPAHLDAFRERAAEEGHADSPAQDAPECA